VVLPATVIISRQGTQRRLAAGGKRADGPVLEPAPVFDTRFAKWYNQPEVTCDEGNDSVCQRDVSHAGGMPGAGGKVENPHDLCAE
jgi:hypothetical protein